MKGKCPDALCLSQYAAAKAEENCSSVKLLPDAWMSLITRSLKTLRCMAALTWGTNIEPKNQVQPTYLDQSTSLVRLLRPSASMSILLQLQKNAVFLELLVAMRSILGFPY